ncbi:Ig-like domain-containing protein [Candidatus Palauibacter sp.]|uniref:Ig-like domain-containing protein n=1 Tax=Candidatus Palauibacter sp. TaxID=3101350 RepID=UPI003C7022D1
MRTGRTRLWVLAGLGGILACLDDPAGPPRDPTVEPPRPASLTVSPATADLRALGDTIRFMGEVRDQSGEIITGATVTWTSSDASVVTVDSAGLATATGPGEGTVTASVGTASGNATVRVAQEASTITVHPASSAISEGDTLRLLAEATDANGHPVPGASFLWGSENESVATVDSSGLVFGAGEGSTEITAAAGSALGSATVTVTGPASDRAALMALYVAAGGPNWRNSVNWATDAPLGDWYGVTVDGSGRVTDLWLRSNDLTGPISREIGKLAGLKVLDLSQNRLAGPVPPKVGRLESLTYLNLWLNELTGPIPPELGNLAQLTYLGLSGNDLSGPIPPELGDLAQLTDLGLSGNDLSGPIPPELGDLAQLTDLGVGGNRLTGSMPRSFLELELRTLLFWGNDGLCLPGTADFIGWAREVRARDFGGGAALLDGPFCNASDVRVLVSLYEATDGADWTNAARWEDVPYLAGGITASLDQWHGISADSLGRVRRLDLSGNGLSGRIPSDLWRLSELNELRIGGNELAGPLPLSLASLALRVFHFADTDLCTPDDVSFREWLAGIPSREGTGVECTSQAYREALASLYEAAGGADWERNDNWLSDAPLGRWYGIETDGQGRVVGLALDANNLAGRIPPEIGALSFLSRLSLNQNRLEGEIPRELGDLRELTDLSLGHNGLAGAIPAAIGDLSNLRRLTLEGNQLSGYPDELGSLTDLEVLDLSGNDMPTAGLARELGNLPNLRVLNLSGCRVRGEMPVELGYLSKLEVLDLSGNDIWGSIPPELGNLSNLRVLKLSHEGSPPRARDHWREFRFTGSIPPELGQLSRLEVLDLKDNSLQDTIPSALGSLSALRELLLSSNRLTGSVPAALGGLSGLKRLHLADNRMLAGHLPLTLTGLNSLEELLVAHTGLCAPSDPGFLVWLGGTGAEGMPRCSGSSAYLIQAIQSLSFPVSLVAGEPALLRVFVTSALAAGELIPPVRARFFMGDAETYVVDIPESSSVISAERDEGSFGASADAEVPGWVIQPGLEMIVDIDPGGELDPALGVAERLPRVGRIPVDVQTLPGLDLTLIPFLYSAAPDSSILDITETLDGQDDLFWPTRTLLPVGALAVDVHAPVVTSRNLAGGMFWEVWAIRSMEGGHGYYMGTMAGSVIGEGAANRVGTSFAIPDPWVMAHQLGRNMQMGVGPSCQTVPGTDGSIGSWGYDFRDGTLVPPETLDLMWGCGPDKWISEYHFTQAFRYRLGPEAVDAAARAVQVRALLLWGGIDEAGAPFLDPAFVVDAIPTLPSEAGDFGLLGRGADGEVLFSLSFGMPEVAGGGGAGFAFTLPVEPRWAGSLASITLSGPGGSATLDENTDRWAAIVRDPLTRQVRAILRDLPFDPGPENGATALTRASARELGLGSGLEVLTSRGLPARGLWRR